MKLYRLYAKQFLPISPSEAWAFLSDPNNLKTITPDHMQFRILSGAEQPMYAGQIIKYVVHPLPGLKTSWVTEITHVEHGTYFVDEQRFGPYDLWHHKHFITPTADGVIMEDLIDYKLPWGFLGRMAHHLFVKNQLRTIFEYREEQLNALFNSNSINRENKSVIIQGDDINALSFNDPSEFLNLTAINTSSNA